MKRNDLVIGILCAIGYEVLEQAIFTKQATAVASDLSLLPGVFGGFCNNENGLVAMRIMKVDIKGKKSNLC